MTTLHITHHNYNYKTIRYSFYKDDPTYYVEGKSNSADCFSDVSDSLTHVVLHFTEKFPDFEGKAIIYKIGERSMDPREPIGFFSSIKELKKYYALGTGVTVPNQSEGE